MNPSNREGWPQSQLPSNANTQPNNPETQSQSARPLGGFGAPNPPQPPQQQPPQPGSGPPSGPVLPPPSGFFSSNASSSHSLPGLAGLTGSATQNLPPAAPARPQPPAQDPPNAPAPPQSSNFTLPGVNQAVHGQHSLQAHPSVEQERDREMRDAREAGTLEAIAARREAEQREREARELQHREQPPPHETHTGPVHIHQPVAVAPVRAIHGPNGLLGNPGAGASAGNPPNILSAQLGPFHQSDANQRVQQPQQQPAQSVQQQNLLVPFPNAGTQQAGSGMSPAAQQPILNDALSYLDQVKVQFADHPDVYNRFLDIMKDFKSGAIDTPGVIERVSQLFAGNPALIQGFNTFLPPGYKIECGAGDDPNTIRVTTPMGTTVSTMPPARPLSNPRPAAVNGTVQAVDRGFYADAMGWGGQRAQESAFGSDGRQIAQTGFSLQSGPTSHPMSPEAHREQTLGALTHQQDQRGVSQLQNALSVGAGMQLGNRQGILSSPGDAGVIPQGMNGGGTAMQPSASNGGIEKRGPVEFNHAISYVNKIKASSTSVGTRRWPARADVKAFLTELQNRFHAQPDIYKQFLEILQTYQRESKPIQEVYAQVTRLFETAPDLLEDFKQFLPESAAQAKAAASRTAGEEAFPLSNARGEPGYLGAAAASQHFQTPRNEPRLPPMGNFAPTPSTTRENKRKRGERQTAATITPTVQADGTVVGSRAGAHMVGKRAKYAHVTKQSEVVQAAPVSPSLVPPLPAPLPPTNQIPPTLDELAFFDRVRKHVANKSQYTEFLKLINLYTQDLCSAQWLVFRVQSFIGNNPELYTYFKGFIGAEPEDEIIDNQLAQPTGRVALSNCRGLGPSYRLLPKSETNKPCTGRDDLCRSVLNDEWASHPTWASEDSGFVAHRKNQYEEGLHRIEEERHDYDTNLGALERSIQLLEPIAQTLSALTVEGRKTYVLSPTLGGQSETIFKRPIFKIYGRDRGKDVIQMMFAQPYQVVPTLLARFKSKREEWLASQREWNKVWRASTTNMFWKSLDHQGAGARQTDKRQFSSKSLQAELMVRDEEQKRQRNNLSQNVPNYLFEFKFEDHGVLYDCITLILVNIENRQDGTESPRLSNFVKEFASIFFGLDQNNMRSSFRDGQSPAEEADEDSGAAEDGLSPRQKPNGKRNESLLRGVLERGRSGRPIRRDDDSGASDSRATTPEPTSIAEEEITGALESPPVSDNLNDRPRASGEKWLDHPVDKNILNGQPLTVQEPYERKSYNMYVNWQLYFYFRLLAMLYDRLSRLKEAEPNVHQVVSRSLMDKDADDLGWRDRVPASFFKTGPGVDYYSQMLVKFEELIHNPTPERIGEVEETLRRNYLYVGWQLYNCDKLVGSIVKQATSVVSGDSKDNSWNIYQAFKKDRQRDETTHQDEVSYRRQVEKLAKDSDVLRIAYETETKTAQIKLLHRHEGTFPERPKTRKERWQAYIASYVRVEPTEQVDIEKLLKRFPFVRRSAGGLDDNLISDNLLTHFGSEEKLTVRVEPMNYSLQLDPESYEWMVRNKQPKIDYDQELWATIHEEQERKAEEVQEKLVMNNEWMKGLTKDEVDAMKTDYGSAVQFDYAEPAVVADRDDAGKIVVGKDQFAQEPEYKDVPEMERSQRDKARKTDLKRKVEKPAFDFDSLPGWKDMVGVPLPEIDEDDKEEE